MTVRALLLAYEFPPLASGGVHRALGFAEHLPACGIELDIVTVRADDYPAWSSAPIDPELLARVPASVRVHRISQRISLVVLVARGAADRACGRALRSTG